MTSLVPIKVDSIYVGKNGSQLSAGMAKATPDTAEAIKGLEADVQARGGKFRLSDLYRSYDAQLRAHLDYTTGKKTAFSPAPGGSFHESGRAMDVDVDALKMPLADFWVLAKKRGIVPIIAKPEKISECWHFECRGPFQKIADYYASKGFKDGYKAMVTAAILDIGSHVDHIPDALEKAAWIQGQLIIKGYDIGRIDGEIGPKTNAAIADAKAKGWAAQSPI